MQGNNSADNSYDMVYEWLRIYGISKDEKEKAKARAMIVARMMPIVKHIAKTIARRDYDPVEDLAQAGFIGLLKAIDKYSEDKNDNFRVYAGYLIIGEIKHYIRDKLHMIRVPRYIQELTIRISNFTRDLTSEEVASLTSDEMASALEVSPKVVDLAMDVERRRTTISLEEMYMPDNNRLSYEEVLAPENYEDLANYEDARIIFDDVIDKLPPEEKVLIDMYYKQDMTKKEIASALMLTQMSVSRKLKRAFNLLAELVAADTMSKKEGRTADEDVGDDEDDYE